MCDQTHYIFSIHCAICYNYIYIYIYLAQKMCRYVLFNFIDLSIAYWLYGQCILSLIFNTFSVVFVRCTDNNQHLYFKCGSQLIQTVIAQWSNARFRSLLVVRLSLVRTTFFLKYWTLYFSYLTILVIVFLMFVCVFWFPFFV